MAVMALILYNVDLEVLFNLTMNVPTLEEGIGSEYGSVYPQNLRPVLQQHDIK